MSVTEMQIIKNKKDSGQNLKDYSNSSTLKERLINEKKDNNKPKSKKKKILLGIFIVLLVGLISIIGVFIFFRLKSQSKEYEKEDLIVYINYKTNMIYRYNLKKKTQMSVDGLVKKENSTKEIEQFSDFFLLIEKENIEKIEQNLKKKKWFTGYLAILNVSLFYEANNTQIIYDQKLNNILNEEEESLGPMEDFSFVKIDFYENGDIKNFYVPNNNFSLSNMQYIKEYSKLIFPKISSILYSNSINQSLNELIEKDNNKENIRDLNEKKENIVYPKKVYKILSTNSIKDSQEFEIEEYISSPNEKSKYYDLREKSNSSNTTCLTEFSMENIENKEVNLKNSELNKTIYSSINKNGLLESVTEIEKAIIINEQNEEEDIREIIFNNKSNISFDINSMSFESINKLNLKEYFTNKKIVKNLFNIFKKIRYEIFNETYYNEYISFLAKENMKKENNLSNETNIFESTEEKNLRRISTDSNTYYGMNKLTNERDLYNYNLLGLKMQKQIFNELDPSTGKISTYFNLIFGNINRKIKTSEKNSNLHIILEKKNKMAFNLIQLLSKTNLDLKQRNKNISQIIINFETNILDLLKDYDYSNSFNECLDQISSQLNSFTGELFDKLILLINNLYENYTIILEEIKNEKFNIFEQILTVTKNEYMNYIYEMINNLENFSNATLLFLDKIEEEVNKIKKIEKIDFLYDILENIYESTLLLKKFNNNLFKSIEKGILSFKIDINEFKETILGDLLYITDFLSINIIKNEIIIRAYDEKILKDLSLKLKNFRNIIQTILDLLIYNINSDYGYEMSKDNKSLKFYSEAKASLLYNKVDKKSSNIIDKIKEKINYNNLYEIYTANLDYINFINNKTIIEFIDDMNNNFLKKIINLQPEYIKKNDYKNIKNQNEINENTYLNHNIIIKYESIINRINYLFFDNETNILFNELREVFNYLIEMNKKIIDDNYQLGMDYVNELYSIVVEKYNGKSYIGEGFYKKYQQFLSMFNQYISLASSKKLFDNLEENYLKVLNETFNYLQDNFFYSESGKKMNLNITLILEQINNYFNIDKFNLFKNESFTFFCNELERYNEIKNISFFEKYEYIFNHSRGIYKTDLDYFYSTNAKNWLTTTNNIEKVNLDVIPNIEYANNKSNIIFENYKKKIKEYLPKYINYIQVLDNKLLNYSNIYEKKDKLFNLTKLVTNEINNEIYDINNFIKNYTNKYKEENLYNIYYYLYKLNNLFFDNETNFLFSELRTAFNNTIEMHKKRIDENYKLGIDYADELNLYLFTYHAGDHKDMGKGAYIKYIKFISLFEEYISLANSEVIFDNLQKNYLKIRNEILNYVKNKLSNITQFYFGNDIYKPNFNFISKFNNEILKISERINTYFNDERFEFFKAEILPYSLNELTKYNEIYNKTLVDKFEYIRSHTDGIYDTEADYRYWYKMWYGHVKNRPNCWIPLTNNIDKVNIDINHTIEYMDNITDIIIENYNKRINKYLSKYIICIQNLYDNLYLSVENKINNNYIIQKIFSEYEQTFNKILISNSNYGLFETLNKNSNEGLFYLNNLEKNIDLLIYDFFNSYYFISYDKFLEYPNEILYKIKQFSYEINDNVNMIRQKIIDISMNKIINIIKTTNIFIEDLVNSNNKYILIHINNNDIMKEYLVSKEKFISNNFENYLKKLSEIERETLDLIKEDNLILAENDFKIPISKIFEKLEIFIYDLEKVINNSFIYEKCYNSFSNNTDLFDFYKNDFINDYNDTNDTNLICENIKFKSNLSDYEYNYNIVKLRSGIFYTKKSLENIMNLFDDLKYDELLNLKEYNKIENELNDKKILDIYNSSIIKLKEINENSNSLLKEQNEYFYQEILNIYSLKNDFYPFLKKLETILKLESKSFNDYYINNFQAKFSFIEPLLIQFNNTLYEQKNEYLLYYIDENNTFKEIFNDYKSQIKTIFGFFNNEVLKLNSSSSFLNSFRIHLSGEQNKKRTYFKNIINNISKFYNYHLLNMTLNIGDIIENYLIKEYEEHEFSLMFELMRIYDLYLNSFLNKIIEQISEMENNILNKFNIIIEEFLEKLYSDSIKKDYYNDLMENYTQCLNYSIDLLNQTLIEDKINYEKYLIILNDSSLNESEKEKIIFINKTEILLDCHNNNYYNYSIKSYKIFDNKYKNKLNNIINEINKLDSSDVSEILSNKYYEQYYELDNYTQSKEVFDDIYYKLFLAYDDAILYINYTQNNIYFDHLYNLLIKSFEPSYLKYINNYLIYPLIENITIFINNQAEIHLHYLINKIKDEYNYYALMLNNTKELGKNSKESFSCLYDDVNKKIDESVSYTINEYILFYIDTFYKNNKYIFKDNCIAYYANENNEYDIKIHQIKEFINEIIYDGKFNKTLNEFSNELFNKQIINKLNNTINDLLYNKLYQAHSTINELNIKLNNILSTIEINEENIKINNIINNYKIILSNQNNKFTFQVSNIPFEHLYSFIKNVLEPPLLEIKLQYNIIEKKILEKLLNITNNFPDFSEIIKKKLAIYDILELIKLLIEKLQYSLIKYQKDLNEDYDNYINKLIHYTYINGIETYDEPCYYSFCSLNISQLKNQTIFRNISHNKNKQNLKIKDISTDKNIYSKNSKIDKLKKINLNKNNIFENINKITETKTNYDETLGAISKDEVISFLLEIRNTIYDLNKTILNNFDANAKIKTDKFITNINGTYKVKLKNTILKSASKFSPILSRESYQELIDNMLKQYYKLDNYINNITIYLKNDMNNLISILANISNYLALLNNLGYNKIIGYFDIFIEIIQDNYEIFDNNKHYLRNLKNNNRFKDNTEEFNQHFDKIKEKLENYFTELMPIVKNTEIEVEYFLIYIINNKEIQNILDTFYYFDDLITIISKIVNFIKTGKLEDEIISDELNLLNYGLPPFIFIFPTFPNLQLRIIPEINLKLKYEMGYEIDLYKNDYSVYFDASGEAEISVSLEIGCYIPAASSNLEISLSVGIKGILGSGAIGMKLSLFINEPKFEIELYYKFNAFSLSFYVLFKIRMNLGIVKLSFAFYLMNKNLFGGFQDIIKHKKEVKIKLIKDITSLIKN